MKNIQFFTKIFVAVTFLGVVAVNYLANALPIAGINTAAVSDSYPNLFAPAGITFAIWGVIYTLLLGYTLYQFGLFQKSPSPAREELFEKVGKLFAGTSVVNIVWVFSWHYQVMWLTVVLMFSLLYLLIKIADIVNAHELVGRDFWFVRVPFSVYFGWITVASIANIVTFLVSAGWKGFGISEALWMVVVLLVGLAIGTARMVKDKNVAYGSVLVWAYSGILYKHMSVGGFGGMYSAVIWTLAVCLIVLVSALAYVGTLSRSNRKN